MTLQICGRLSSPSEAEDAVCFKLCQELFNLGILDHRFFPKDDCLVLSEANTSLQRDSPPETSKSSNTTRRYGKKRPQLLMNTICPTTSRLFPLVVEVGPIGGQSHAPMLILAQAPFPQLFDFKVFCAGQSATVSLRRAAPLYTTEGSLSSLYRYSLRISRAVINKALESRLETFPLLFAPLSKNWKGAKTPDQHWWQLPSVEEHILWEDVEKVVDAWATKLIPDGADVTEGLLDDCIVQDRTAEFTNRHFVVKIARNVTPMSKPEEGLREANCSSYLEYCKARRKGFEGLKDNSQPMIEVSQVSSAVNNLAPTCGLTTPPQQKFVLKYLIPELCFRFNVPARYVYFSTELLTAKRQNSTFRTALLLPSVTHMLERMLLTKELNARYFDDEISDEQLLAALSPPVANIEYDYERLELLGDTYLKYIAATYLYVTMPGRQEGQLNRARIQIVSNKSLHAGALKFGLPPYIQSKPLVTKIWQPFVTGSTTEEEGIELLQSTDATKDEKQVKRDKGGKRKRQMDEQSIQWLGDKTIADVVEAILGAALLSGGHNLAFRAAKLLYVDLPQISTWADLLRIPATTIRSFKALPQSVVEAVETITGYQFPEPHILCEALTHSTVVDAPANYGRLEFLGDAVLDMLTVSYIFEKYPHSTPGTLSLLKSAMVSNQTLAALCVLTSLHEAVQCGGDIGRAITAYGKRINGLKAQEYKSATTERRLPGQFWLEVEPPKILSDIIESVLGAIFVSEKFNIHSVQPIFDKVFKPFYLRHIRLQTLSPHPTTTLFELFQAEHCHAHRIRKEVHGRNVYCYVVVHETDIASGTDRGSNMAARKAAIAALDVLSDDPGLVSRICDCRAGSTGKKVQNKAQLGYEDEVETRGVEHALGVEGT
ncbi:hypothetical protein BDY19DRAFT_1027492 [Irpex rosettiformis]|uniref:Uncharacterized protein n=1 Tax=Irpex rosettiformis TaxID=378272 RepID=A0ACB8UDE2_9APHY|nr:hypothetical protein BDY19DRAFT_1027492 [Irpex rosettiformis]